MKKRPSRARLDADKTATGKTRLMCHVQVLVDGRTHSLCSGPADTWVGEDGEHVRLMEGPDDRG